MMRSGPFFDGIDGKSDAVCRRGVVKKIFMDEGNLFFRDEMENDFLRGNFEFFKQIGDRLSHLRKRNREVSLCIMEGNLSQI